MKKLLSLLVLLSCIVQVGFADVPFRTHRYESFKSLKTNPQSIVFAGNSITNMHEWWEAFSCNENIVNRGNSGGYTQEIIDNLESYLTGRPAKMFLMIGTNDLGTSGLNNLNYVAGNIRAIAKRVVKESPSTKLYIESILPSNNGLRNNALTQQVNDSLRRICNEFPTVEYVDLWDTMFPMGNKSGTLGKTTNSYDNLHPNAWGYAMWCNQIADKVGSPCAYPAEDLLQLFNGGFSDSWGSRITQFTSLPTTAEDVLIIGEEMIHGGEWHELLHSAHVKGRGTGWGFGDNLNRVVNTIDPMFNGYNGVSKVEPKQIFLSLGIGQVAGNTDINTIKTTISGVVDKVKSHCPNAQLFIMGCHPLSNATNNANRVIPFNNLMKTLATDKGATYVDIYTPLLGTTANTAAAGMLNSGNYIGALGYAKISEVLAPYIEGATATTQDEVSANLTLYNNRNALGSKISALELFTKAAVGDGVGQFPASAITGVEATLEEAYALLAQDPTTVSATDLSQMGTRLDAAKNELASQVNQPKASTAEQTILYTLKSARGNRYATGNGANNAITGNTAADAQKSVWKLVLRADNTFNIVNNGDGTYISPASTTGNALKAVATEPSAGWQFSYSNVPGSYIIYSGTAQFNQAGNGAYNVLQWGGGSNRDDEGCRYYINEVETAGPRVSGEGKTIWYRLQSQREGRYVKTAGAGNALTGVVSDDTEATQWCFEQRADGTLDIINRADHSYISPASSHNTALKATENEPTAGWSYKFSAAAGYFVIHSGTSAQFNQTGSGQSYAVYNWYGNNGCPNLTDEGCHYRFIEVEATDETIEVIPSEPEPQPEPVLTLLDRSSDGTAPVKLTDAQAQKIFDIAGGAMTVAIDFTVATPQTGSGAFNAHTLICTAGEDATDEYTEFFSVAIRNGGGGYGVEYIGITNHQIGWYTGSGVAFNNKRSTMVVTMDPATGYDFYHDGAYGRNVGPISAFGQYGFRSLSNINGQHSIYLLGAINNKGVLRFPTVGTIHSLRVYPQTLTRDQVLALTYDNLTETEITPTAIDAPATATTPKTIYDLQGRRVAKATKGLYIVDGKKVVR